MQIPAAVYQRIGIIFMVYKNQFCCRLPLDSYLFLLLSQATPHNKPNSNMKHER